MRQATSKTANIQYVVGYIQQRSSYMKQMTHTGSAAVSGEIDEQISTSENECVQQQLNNKDRVDTTNQQQCSLQTAQKLR